MAKIRYEEHRFADPLLPFYLSTDFRTAGIASVPNWHSNLELLYGKAGTGRYQGDCSDLPFEEGDLIVVNSNALHDVAAEKRSFHYIYLLIDEQFCLENGIDLRKISFYEKPEDKRCVEAFLRITEAYEMPDGWERIPTIRTAVLELLLTLCKHVRPEKEKTGVRTTSLGHVKNAIFYIRTRLSKPLSLDGIAEYVGVSKYYLAREFRRITELKIFEYINILRCQEARRLLKDGSSVSAAAFVSGFDNLSYFSRTYKKYVGELPSQTALAVRAEKGEKKDARTKPASDPDASQIVMHPAPFIQPK